MNIFALLRLFGDSTQPFGSPQESEESEESKSLSVCARARELPFGKTGESRRFLGATEALALALRGGLKAALVEHRPCVIVDFADELEMARHAEAAWPGAKIRRIVAQLEAERVGRVLQ